MPLIKICPTCRTVNNPSEMMCIRCFGDISGVSPQEDKPVQADRPDNCNIINVERIILTTLDGKEIPVKNGDIVGREALGEKVLDPYPTISRRHARFSFEAGQWFIEDLKSTNGVYLDNIRIEPNRKIELRNNQNLSLSSSCKMVVLIK